MQAKAGKKKLKRVASHSVRMEWRMMPKIWGKHCTDGGLSEDDVERLCVVAIIYILLIT